METPIFINASGTTTVQAGWKNILIIPSGTVTLANTLNPSETMTITSPLAIGANTPNIEIWGDIIITGTAEVIINGSAISS